MRWLEARIPPLVVVAMLAAAMWGLRAGVPGPGRGDNADIPGAGGPA